MKNIKSMFFVGLLLVLLVGVSQVSASDLSNDTIVPQDTTDTIAQDVTTTTTSDNIVKTTKTIEKEQKNIKTATKTVEVNNFDELNTAITSAVQDSENITYEINLNEGLYEVNANYGKGTYSRNIIIYGNNQELKVKSSTSCFGFKNVCNNTINQSIININLGIGSSTIPANMTLNNVTTLQRVNVYQGSILTLNNCTINSTSASVIVRGTLIIGDDVIFNSQLSLLGNVWNIITNNTNIIYPYLNTFNNNGTLSNITIEKRALLIS